MPIFPLPEACHTPSKYLLGDAATVYIVKDILKILQHGFLVADDHALVLPTVIKGMLAIERIFLKNAKS